jgi:hypothetical protein
MFGSSMKRGKDVNAVLFAGILHIIPGVNWYKVLIDASPIVNSKHLTRVIKLLTLGPRLARVFSDVTSTRTILSYGSQPVTGWISRSLRRKLKRQLRNFVRSHERLDLRLPDPSIPKKHL